MYCIHCGKELPEEAKFCYRCGKAVAQRDGTYSYVYKKAKTPPDPKVETESGTYSYKKGDMPAGSTADTEDGSYRHVYKKPVVDSPKTDPPKTDPPKTDSPKTPPTSKVGTTSNTNVPPSSGTKPPNPSTANSKPAASQSNAGCSGCLTWILVLACVLCFYFWVFKPKAQEKGWFGMTEPTAAAEEVEETQAQENPQPSGRAARLPGIREEHMDLPLFDSRFAGPCKTLEGSVGITVLFVNDGESSWTQDKMDEFLYAVHQACGELTSEASAWGKSLSFSVQTSYGTVTDSIVPSIANYNITQIASSAGYSSNQGEFLEQLKAATHAESVPVIVAFNKAGRSFATPIGGDFSQVEACYIFDDPDAVKHELLHLFGAADFYYHDYMDWSAGQYLGNSVMASTGGPVDEMTAYLIGWTDTLTENASMFVYSVAAVGTEGLDSASDENQKSGYGTVTLSDGAVYTGMLSMGVPDGSGEIVWPNGNRYSGDFDQGALHGYGTFYWANGDVYTGDFVQSARTGYGTYSWINGDVYQGYFQDGNMHGQGTLTYSNGQVQSGYWENNQFFG